MQKRRQLGQIPCKNNSLQTGVDYGSTAGTFWYQDEQRYLGAGVEGSGRKLSQRLFAETF